MSPKCQLSQSPYILPPRLLSVDESPLAHELTPVPPTHFVTLQCQDTQLLIYLDRYERVLFCSRSVSVNFLTNSVVLSSSSWIFILSYYHCKNNDTKSLKCLQIRMNMCMPANCQVNFYNMNVCVTQSGGWCVFIWSLNFFKHMWHGRSWKC